MRHWSGLGSWEIRQFRGSQDQYHRYLDVYYRHAGNMTVTDDKEPVAGNVRPNWHSGMPEAPEGPLDETTMALTGEEAQYLRNNVVMQH